jgi:hypothetical protein
VEIYDKDGISILGVGELVNLGINCAGLNTTVRLKKEQEFFMRFFLEKKYLMNVWAKVIRVVLKEKKKFYGLRFTKTDILHEKDMKIFLEQKLKETKNN